MLLKYIHVVVVVIINFIVAITCKPSQIYTFTS